MTGCAYGAVALGHFSVASEPTASDDGASDPARHRTTLRVLIVEGLRRSIAECRRATAFRLRKATFKGTGLQPGAAGSPWERIRELAYDYTSDSPGRTRVNATGIASTSSVRSTLCRTRV